MKIAVLGYGAVGGVIAACLTGAGHRVTPIVSNPAIEKTLSTNGYRLSELGSRERAIALTSIQPLLSKFELTNFETEPGPH